MMKRKIGIFLFLFIISIFVKLKDEGIEKRYIYTLEISEIKAVPKYNVDKYAVLNISSNNDTVKNLIKKDIENSDGNSYLFGFEFTPIIKIYSNNLNFTFNYKEFNNYTILKRYSKRVLRI